MFEGWLVVGIVNFVLQFVFCNLYLIELVEWVVCGVLEVGGFFLIFLIMFIGDLLMWFSGMMYCNLMSMELEELIWGNFIDGVVLLIGCDNIGLVYVMGVVSVDLLMIIVYVGLMMSGNFCGKQVGLGIDMYKFYDDICLGLVLVDVFVEVEFGMLCSIGVCNIMGMVLIMGVVFEVFGMLLFGSFGIFVLDVCKKFVVQFFGCCIVDLICQNLCMLQFVMCVVFENVICVNVVIGGGINIMVYFLVLVGWLGFDLMLDDIEVNSWGILFLVNILLNGEYLMEEFYNVGGLFVLMKFMQVYLNLNVLIVLGQMIVEVIVFVEIFDDWVIVVFDIFFKIQFVLVVLCGNLVFDGVIIKVIVVSLYLLQYCGKVVVFELIEDMDVCIDRFDLDVSVGLVLVLKNIGFCSYFGVFELGNIKVLCKLLDQGVIDVLCILDGWMSGMVFGIVVLQIVFEIVIGGFIVLVEEGDEIELDLENCILILYVVFEVLDQCCVRWQLMVVVVECGYCSLFVNYVL